MIELIGNTTFINNLSYGIIYEICMRCRERFNDQYTTKDCQQIRIPTKFCKINPLIYLFYFHIYFRHNIN